MKQVRDETRVFRIAHVIDDLHAAGAQLVLKLVLQHMEGNSFTHHVYTFTDGVIGAQIRELGIPVTVLPRRCRRLDPTLVWRLRRCFRDDRIELVNTHIFGATLHGSLAAWLAGHIPVVATEHNVNDRHPIHNRLANRFLLPRIAAVIAVSDAVAASLQQTGVNGRNISTIANGIDADRFGPGRDAVAARQEMAVPLNAFVIGNVGHLQPQKNQTQLIAALQGLRAQGYDAYLVIVGDDLGTRELLVAEANRRDVELFVRLLGPRDDVPLLLAGFDVFALSSLWEGLPMALLEAMAASVPCVSTPVGGVPDVIQDGANGILVLTNDPEALADALRMIADDPEFANRLARAGRQTVDERFSAITMAHAYEEVYTSVLQHQPMGP